MITDQEIINKCAELYDSIDGVNLIAILKTDRAGDTVDNGMGVEFDIKPYYLLYQIETREVSAKGDIFSKASNVLYDNDLDKYISSDMLHSDELEEDIERYHSVDNYNPIWISPKYKKTKPPSLSLERHTGDISIVAKKQYKLFMSYEELKRYLKDKKSYFYQCDLFNMLVEQIQKSHKILDNEYYVSDKTKLKETIYTEKGIEFYFKISNCHGIVDGHDRLFFPISDPNPGLVKALENKKLIVGIIESAKTKMNKFLPKKAIDDGSSKKENDKKG